MAVAQWGSVGLFCEEDGWYGESSREMTFVQAAVVAQAVASYMKNEIGTRNGMIVGFSGDLRGYLYAERIAEVLAGNDVIVWLCEGEVSEGQLCHAIRQEGLDGGLLVTGFGRATLQGLKFLSPENEQIIPAHIEPYVREIEAGVRGLQVKPYAQASREGALLLCAFQM
ncbi:hypothetical protein [Tumebacillus flagellatus]|uniref:Alpha-D-phosphohexomutase alpha/beta/alpha domain-containing protein n=1 Tax=Tumebacillus flagellatus TaxID=1157490 RepID=A0A074LTB5_9BACL|nr:hypothetical protein [Tumebacillus flagellatus]KEO83765.1 hypothetical protein EL26_07550 [Tumebacillus flagellatus]